MRISADPKDIGYKPELLRKTRVFFNGVEIVGVRTADDRIGFVEQYLFDEKGRVRTNKNGDPVILPSFGQVRIEIQS